MNNEELTKKIQEIANRKIAEKGYVTIHEVFKELKEATGLPVGEVPWFGNE